MVALRFQSVLCERGLMKMEEVVRVKGNGFELTKPEPDGVIIDYTALLGVRQKSVDAVDSSLKVSKLFFDRVIARDLGFEDGETTVDQILANF
jgi:hypothetical protein